MPDAEIRKPPRLRPGDTVGVVYVLDGILTHLRMELKRELARATAERLIGIGRRLGQPLGAIGQLERVSMPMKYGHVRDMPQR